MKKKSRLHGLLGTIFSEELKPEEKALILDREYDIKTEVEVKEGMGKMCNLSDAIEERGMEKKLIEQICRKIKKGKNLSVIAEELEEEESTIANIYETALSAAPDYEWEKVYASLHRE